MRTVLRVAAWLVTALLVAATVRPMAAEAAPELAISGDVSRLQVGVPARLVLTVSNAAPTEAVVTRLSARVTGTSGACAVSALRVQPWTGRLVVPGHGQAQRALSVVLVEPCPDATFSLAYAAS